MRKSAIYWIMTFSLVLFGPKLWAQSPVIFFSDLDGGPASGGENNNGAFVTIYGNNFGGTQGASTVTVGGGAVNNYRIWSNTKVVVQIGANARSGNIIAIVNGQASNGVPFIVRSGNIFFVSNSASASDNNNGSFASPWKTIPKAKNTIAAGDIAYVMNGVSQTGVDDHDASLDVAEAGTAGNPKALVAYPGATATIGSGSGQEFGLRTPQISGGPFSNWTIAGFVIRGNNEGIDLEQVDHWRIIGNDISVPSPNGGGPTAVVEVSESTNVAFLGNNIHDSGAGDTKLYHSLYFTSDSNQIEVGWNTIQNNKTCRGIQFHSTFLGGNTGLNQHDLSVHDNLIHGQICDGINFATIDPSKGPVLAFNNIVYNVGLGPDPTDGSSDYACFLSAGITNNGPAGTGTAQVFNNTFYDCGHCATTGNCDTSATGSVSVQSGSPIINLVNNIMDAPISKETYITTNSSTGLMTSAKQLVLRSRHRAAIISRRHYWRSHVHFASSWKFPAWNG